MEIGKDCIGIGCGVLIFDRENRLLLIKRSNNAKIRPGEWSLPGGKVDFGEKSEDAIIRETAEEIGVKIKIKKFIGYSDEIHDVWHWLLLHYQGEILEGQPTILEPNKFDGIEWFKITDLPSDSSYYHVLLPLEKLGLLPNINNEKEGNKDLVVIGAIGYIGAGKDTALDIMANEYNFNKVSFGDIARDIARSRGWVSSRENLHKISIEFFEKHGIDYFPRKIIEEIEQSSMSRVVISGIRTFTDIKTLKDHFGKRFVLLYVDASREARFQRLMARNEERDSNKFENFLEQEKEEDHKFGISEAISYADYQISNEEDITKLKEQIMNLMPKLNPDE